MNNNTKRYESKLKRKLQCNRATKARLLDEFSHSLDGFLDENPDATFADLSNAFGPPEEMAHILMERLSVEEIRQYRRHICVKRVVAAFCAAAVLIFTLYVFFYKDLSNVTYNPETYIELPYEVTEGE